MQLPLNSTFLGTLLFVHLPTLGLDPLLLRWASVMSVSLVPVAGAGGLLCRVNATLKLELG